jgi:hypothetical protein
MTDTDHIVTPATHTPGPWEVSGDRDDSDGLCVVEKATGRLICLVESTLGYAAADEANARLIAAAPDLLEALDYLLQQTVDQDLEYGIGLSEGEEDAQAKALAAIAKATTLINQPERSIS